MNIMYLWLRLELGKTIIAHLLYYVKSVLLPDISPSSLH